MALMLADIFVPAPEEPVLLVATWEVGYQLTSDIAKLELDISTRYTLLSYDPESGTAQLGEASFVVYETVLEPNPGVSFKPREK